MTIKSEDDSESLQPGLRISAFVSASILSCNRHVRNVTAADNNPTVKHKTIAPADEGIKLCENKIAAITPATNGALALLCQKLGQ
jgi:hypothetical protein